MTLIGENKSSEILLEGRHDAPRQIGPPITITNNRNVDHDGRRDSSHLAAVHNLNRAGRGRAEEMS